MAIRLLLITVSFLLVSACVRSRDAVTTNLTWLTVASYAKASQAPTQLAALTQNALQINDAIAPGNQLVRLNSGILAAIRGSEATALANWRAAPLYRDRLVGFGQTREALGRLDDALLFYQGSGGDQMDRAGWYQLAGLCQRTFAQPERLLAHNQRICATVWVQNKNNLLINPNFVTATRAGWFDHTDASTVDSQVGVPAPAATVSGVAGQSGQGLYQLVSLPVGATVHFSTYFRSKDALPDQVRLLYVGRTMLNGKAAGNQLPVTVYPANPEWTYLERTFVVPDAQDNLFRIAPALVDAQGAVEIDQVRLEIVKWP